MDFFGINTFAALTGFPQINLLNDWQHVFKTDTTKMFRQMKVFAGLVQRSNTNYAGRAHRGFCTLFNPDLDLRADFKMNKVITAFEKDETMSIEKVAKAGGVERMEAFIYLKMLRLQHISQGKPVNQNLVNILEDVRPHMVIPPQRYPKFEILDDLEESGRPDEERTDRRKAKATHREVPKWRVPQKKRDRKVLGVHQMKNLKYVCVDVGPV